MPVPFVDRTSELSYLDRALTGSDPSAPRIHVLVSRPAVGLSSFLRHASQELDSDRIVIYVDCGHQAANSVFAQLLLGLYQDYHEIWLEFQEWVRVRSAGLRDQNTTVAAMSGIPYVGSSLHAPAAPRAQPVAITEFASAVAELVCEFLQRLTTRRVVAILLDNAHLMDPWSRDLLRTTVGRSYGRLHYVMGLVTGAEGSVAAEDFVGTALGIGYRIERRTFEPPGRQLVLELSEHLGVEMSPQQAEAINRAAGANIYRIFQALEALLPQSTGNAVMEVGREEEPLDQEILGFLQVARQPLRRSDLLTLCSSSDTVLFEGEEHFDRRLKDLEVAGILRVKSMPGGDRLFETETVKGGLAASLPESLVYSRRLYDFGRRALDRSVRHSQAELLPLLYRLSKEVAPEATARHAQAVLALSLKLGSLSAAEEFVREATLPDADGLQRFPDYMIQVGFYLATRLRERALRLLQNPPRASWKAARPVRVLTAIALNRCRRHAKSERLIRDLLRTPGSSEEKVILACYEIACYLHTNRVAAAQEKLHAHARRFSGARNFPYLLRNGASCLSAEQAVEYLASAVFLFARNGDDFGKATALNNLATSFIELNRLDLSAKALQEAHESLEIFGYHHLHIVRNNLGIFHLKRRNLERAQEFLRQSISISGTAMPKIFSRINLAAVHALAGRRQDALTLLRDMAGDVEGFPVDRVRQRYYLNAAAVYLVAGGDPEAVAALLEAARRHPDRMAKDITEAPRRRMLRHLSSHSRPDADEFLDDLFIPCYLSYWYQNPLHSLQADLLTPEAVQED